MNRTQAAAFVLTLAIGAALWLVFRPGLYPGYPIVVERFPAREPLPFCQVDPIAFPQPTTTGGFLVCASERRRLERARLRRRNRDYNLLYTH